MKCTEGCCDGLCRCPTLRFTVEAEAVTISVVSAVVVSVTVRVVHTSFEVSNVEPSDGEGGLVVIHVVVKLVTVT